MEIQDNSIQQAAAILGKVQALLAKTVGNGCTEQEASAAAAKVQALLAAHNLNMAALQNKEAPVYEVRQKTNPIKTVQKYQRKLMETLAHNNFCLCFSVDGSNGKSHQILGRQVNVLATLQTYEYLTDTMRKLNPYRGERQNANHWYDGCAERLVERLNTQRYHAEEESRKAKRDAEQSGNGTDLLVLSDVYGSEQELNEDAYYNLAPGTTAARNRKWAAQAAAYREQERAYERKTEELIASGMDKHSAWYVARGREVPPIEKEKPETKREKEARERRSERLHAKWDREAERDALRKSNAAYQAGRLAGDKIGLDRQVERQGTAQIA